MLQRKTVGKVSLRHVEEGEQGAGVHRVCVCVCVCVCVRVYIVECKFWNIPDSTFTCMDRTVGVQPVDPFRPNIHDIHFTHLTLPTVQFRQSLSNAFSFSVPFCCSFSPSFLYLYPSRIACIRLSLAALIPVLQFCRDVLHLKEKRMFGYNA
jgi:hypothetical protein